MEHTFTSDTPVRLYVELGSGRLDLTAADVRTTTIHLTGSGAEDTEVFDEDDQITIIAPNQRSGFLGGRSQEVNARVELPAGSQVITRTGSADQRMAGTLRMVRAASGSGDVTVEHVDEVVVVETGSGSVELVTAGGEARLKTGSGGITVQVATGPLAATTGSGDITVEHTESDVALKTGSGSVRLGTVRADVALTTGSGDAAIGRLEGGHLHAKSGSGDLRLGVAGGIPVWTDISTASGRISSDLAGAGEPTEGQPHLEIRARTSSGDITLQQR